MWRSTGYLAISFLLIFGGTEAAGQPQFPQSRSANDQIQLRLDPNQVTGGSKVRGVVQATITARGEVALASGDSAVASVPQSVLLSPQRGSAEFIIQTHPVAIDGIVQITATATHGFKATAILHVLAPILASLEISPSNVVSSPHPTVPTDSNSKPPGYATGTVTTSGPAPDGFKVSLSSQNSQVATLPAEVLVPAGASSATFRVAVPAVAAPTAVELTARQAEVTKTATVTALVGVNSITFPDVVSGNTTSGKITLTGPAPAGGALIQFQVWRGNFCYNLIGCCFPPPYVPSVTVPAGALEAPFEVSVKPSKRNPVDPNIRPSIRIFYLGAQVGEHSFVISPPRFSALEIPAQVKGGETVLGKIKLNSVLPDANCIEPNQYMYVLSSNASVAQVPASVIIAPKTSESVFEIKTSSVTANQTVTIQLGFQAYPGANPSSVQRTLVVTP